MEEAKSLLLSIGGVVRPIVSFWDRLMAAERSFW